MRFETLPYLPKSQQVKADQERTMRRGNLVLKKWLRKVKSKAQLPRYSRLKFLNNLLKLLPNLTPEAVEIHGVTIPAKDVEKILAVKLREQEIIETYSRVVGQAAFKWSVSKDENDDLGFNDLYEEAFLAMLSAIYSYTTKASKFITYLHLTVMRKMIRICYRISKHLPGEAVELFKRYTEAKSGFNRPTTFDEVIEKLGLSERQQTVLKTTLVQIRNASSIQESDADDGDIRTGTDYSQLGLTAAGMDGSTTWGSIGSRSGAGILTQKSTVDFDMVDAVNMAQLSDVENAALEGFLLNGTSGQTSNGIGESGKDLVNPKTGKAYSRMTFTYAFERAKEKVRSAYQRKERFA